MVCDAMMIRTRALPSDSELPTLLSSKQANCKRTKRLSGWELFGRSQRHNQTSLLSSDYCLRTRTAPEVHTTAVDVSR